MDAPAHDQRCIRQILIIPVDDFRLWAKRRSIAEIGRDRLGAPAGPVDDDDVAGAVEVMAGCILLLETNTRVAYSCTSIRDI